MSSVKGQYFLLGSMIIAITILSYFLMPSLISPKKYMCSNQTIESVAMHNAYALCNTSLLIYGLKEWGYVYCENHNLTHLLCVLQNCSSSPINIQINYQKIDGENYITKYIKKATPCIINISSSTWSKIHPYHCFDPVYHYWYKEDNAIILY